MPMQRKPQCQAISQKGGRCKNTVVRDRWCRWHHPEMAEERHAWSVKGGQHRANVVRLRKQLPAEPLTVDEIHSYLGIVFRGVIAGKLEPGIANAAANVARAMMDVAKVADFEGQLSELRRAIAELSEERLAS